MVITCKYEDCKHQIHSPTLPSECPKCHGHWLEEGEDYELLHEILVGCHLICSLTQTAHEYLISEEGTILGRKDFDWIGARKAYISGQHCEISIENNQLYISDLNSTNGTYIGLGSSQALKNKTALNNGAYLVLGRETFLVQYLYQEKEISPTSVTPSVARCVDCMTILSELTPCVCNQCGAWNE